MSEKNKPYVLTPQDIENLRGRALKNSVFDIYWLARDHHVTSEFQKYYQDYLKRGFHRDLQYLENCEVKFDPEKIFESIGSIAVLPIPYFRRENEKFMQEAKWRLSRFAWGLDYHHVTKELLARVFEGYEPFRVVVDSTPLPERYFARRAGIGFCGRNSMIIHPRFGSYFFLSFVFLKALLPETWQAGLPFKKESALPEEPAEDIARYCGDCDLCVRACPGGALAGDGSLDCNKCYSYWSIENRDSEISLQALEGKSWGKRIYGCDICQEVCPYNRTSSLPEGVDAFSVTEQVFEVAQGFAPLISRKQREKLAIGRGYKNLQRNKGFIQKLLNS